MGKRIATILGIAAVAIFMAALSWRVFVSDARVGTPAPGGGGTGGDTPPAAALKPSRQSKPAWPADPSQPLDLLGVINTENDSVEGVWGFLGQNLVTSAVPYGRLQVPCIAPEEYDLKLVLKRVKGSNSFNIGLTCEGRPFLVVLDGSDGVTSGLDLLKGKGFSDNETTFRGKTLWPKKEMTVECSVRKTGVSVSVEGNPLFHWKGSYDQLGVLPQWQCLNKKALWLGTWDSVFHVSQIILTPVTGTWSKVPEGK
jgi:hypothetical protein